MHVHPFIATRTQFSKPCPAAAPISAAGRAPYTPPASTPTTRQSRRRSSIVEALPQAGAHPEATVAATHGLLLDGAREKLDQEAVREVVLTDNMAVGTSGWSNLRIVSVGNRQGEWQATFA